MARKGSKYKDKALNDIMITLSKYGGPGPHGWKPIMEAYPDISPASFHRWVAQCKEAIGVERETRPEIPDEPGALIAVSRGADEKFVYDFDDRFRMLVEDADALRDHALSDGHIRSPTLFQRAWQMNQRMWRDGLWALQEGREARIIQEYWDAMTEELKLMDPDAAARLVSRLRQVHSRFASKLSTL